MLILSALKGREAGDVFRDSDLSQQRLPAGLATSVMPAAHGPIRSSHEDREAAWR
jgi:hypothetical protein